MGEGGGLEGGGRTRGIGKGRRGVKRVHLFICPVKKQTKKENMLNMPHIEYMLRHYQKFGLFYILLLTDE